MLDKIHPPLPCLPMDQNAYILGSIGEQNIVIASLPTGAYGNTSAATVGMQLLSVFNVIRGWDCLLINQSINVRMYAPKSPDQIGMILTSWDL
jgi:hypothetical protein